MKNNSSSRANKGKVGYRTPHAWIADKPELLKRDNARMKMNNKKFKAHPGPFTH